MKALFAYIPVVHSGVLTFLNETPGLDIILLDNEKARNVNKFLERDIRALSSKHIKTELLAHGFKNVFIADQDTLADLLQPYSEVFIPKDEIIADFVLRFAPQVRVQEVPLFIRWTKMISAVEHEVPAHRVITEDVFARNVLSQLEKQAEKSSDWWRQIAAGLIIGGKQVVTTYNKHYPTEYSLAINGDPRSNLDAGEGPGIYTSIHAEAWAIAKAAKEGIETDGADLYVTTFPCPTCARLLVESGIRRVFYKKGYSLLDAEEILRGADIEIVLVK